MLFDTNMCFLHESYNILLQDSWNASITQKSPGASVKCQRAEINTKHNPRLSTWFVSEFLNICKLFLYYFLCKPYKIANSTYLQVAPFTNMV